MPQSRSPFNRLWRWVKDQIVQDVSKESAICEFDCRKEQCTMGEWETCERRLDKAAGEQPMPLDRRACKEQTEKGLSDGEITATHFI
jgi:hypothetical protein